MRIALLGATGFVGSALLKESLDRGHIVTAIVRHPEKLEKRDGLIAKAGDVYDTTSLAKLIQENDAIISAFNPGWKDPNLYDDQVRGTASIIAAIKKAGIKRVLWVGRGGWFGGQNWSPHRRQPRSPKLGEAWFSGDDRSGPTAERTGTGMVLSEPLSKNEAGAAYGKVSPGRRSAFGRRHR